MSLVLHIMFAIASLAITGVTMFVPSQSRVRIVAGSIALTIGSGVYLGVMNHAIIAHVCTSGLTYLALETVGVAFAVRRMKRAAVQI